MARKQRKGLDEEPKARKEYLLMDPAWLAQRKGQRQQQRWLEVRPQGFVRVAGETEEENWTELSTEKLEDRTGGFLSWIRGRLR